MADNDIQMLIDGVDGESRAKDRDGWCDVESFSWGAVQSGSMHVGGGGGAGKVAIQDVTVVKGVDKASPTIALKCCKGDHVKEVTLALRKPGGKQEEYYTIKLENVLISSYQTSGATNGPAMDTFSLNFEKISYDYKPQKKDGSLDSAVSLVWNVPEGTDE